MRIFLWGSTTNKRKFHLLSWDQVCIEMKWGGLGIKRVEDVNELILCNWLWLLGDDEPKLLKKVIFGKYGQERGVSLQKIAKNLPGVDFGGVLYPSKNSLRRTYFL